VLDRVGLPTTYDRSDFESLHEVMKVDKKARGSQLRFVVLDDIAAPAILAGPSEADLRAAFDRMRRGNA
jgi:3-dehydroquinate synthase